MPASMIRAPTGGSPNVIGSSMAMVASGPMPGNTPIKVPTSAADQTEPEIDRRQRNRKSERKILKQFHPAFLRSVQEEEWRLQPERP